MFSIADFAFSCRIVLRPNDFTLPGDGDIAFIRLASVHEVVPDQAISLQPGSYVENEPVLGLRSGFSSCDGIAGDQYWLQQYLLMLHLLRFRRFYGREA